jgi:hypothetical protein
MFIYEFIDYVRKCLWNTRRPGIDDELRRWYFSEAEKTIYYVEECIKQQEALHNENH